MAACGRRHLRQFVKHGGQGITDARTESESCVVLRRNVFMFIFLRGGLPAHTHTVYRLAATFEADDSVLGRKRPRSVTIRTRENIGCESGFVSNSR